jgi:hypothetical protein
VVFKEKYKDISGIDFLTDAGIKINHIENISNV